MMKAANLWDCDDLVCISRYLRWSGDGAVLIKRGVNAAPIIVVDICTQNTSQVNFVHDDHMVQALSTDRPDCSLDVYVLPWRLFGGDMLGDTQLPDPFGELPAVAAVPIPDQIVWSGTLREGFRNFAREPILSGMLCGADVQDFAAIQANDDHRVQQSEGHGNNDEHVDRRGVVHMILKKRFPTGRRPRRKSLKIMHTVRFVILNPASEVRRECGRRPIQRFHCTSERSVGAARL